MSHIDPRAKIALGFVCLTLSMSVTFFSPSPTSPSNRISFSSFAEVRRVGAVERSRETEETEESERLLREVTALQEDLARMDRIEPAVSSPAP